jgi:Transposase IS200 like
MPWGLKRYYGTGSLHFITWSCYRRKPLLCNPSRRDLLLAVLDLMRVRYRFAVIGYVVMPEHVHLLISRAFDWRSFEDNSGGGAERLPAAGHCRRTLGSILAESFL